MERSTSRLERGAPGRWSEGVVWAAPWWNGLAGCDLNPDRKAVGERKLGADAKRSRPPGLLPTVVPPAVPSAPVDEEWGDRESE